MKHNPLYYTGIGSVASALVPLYFLNFTFTLLLVLSGLLLLLIDGTLSWVEKNRDSSIFIGGSWPTQYDSDIELNLLEAQRRHDERVQSFGTGYPTLKERRTHELKTLRGEGHV